MSDFVEIKGYPNYVIKKLGVVKNVKTNKILYGGVGNSDYLQVRITNNVGICLTWGLHRLLAWVFIAKFEDISNLVVNHLDGNKLNNALSNLEITTPQKNVEHAGELGLTEKCKPILVKDISTGVETKYPSIIAYARIANLSKDVVSSRGYRGECYHYDGLQFKFGSDSFTKLTPIRHTGRDIPISIRNVFTGEIEEVYNSFTAAVHLKVSIATISKYINDKPQPVLKGFVQIKP